MNRWHGERVGDWTVHVGKRCIVVKDSYSSSAVEVKVLEVSPSGKLVKFSFPSEITSWEHTGEYLLVEQLSDIQ